MTTSKHPVQLVQGWVLACIVPNIVTVAIGIFPLTLFWITTAWSAAELTAATLVGAWIYRENPSHAHVPPAASRTAHV